MQTNVGKEKELTASLIREKEKLEKDKIELETTLKVQTVKLAESNNLIKELGVNKLKVVEEDVLIVFLSSDQLRLSTYLTVFKDLFLGTNALKLPERMRLGLVEIVGKEVTDIVPLENRKQEDMERNFTYHASGSTARLEELGKLIAERFPGKKGRPWKTLHPCD